MDKSSIIQKLQSFGLTNEESAVYFNILQHGIIAISDLALFSKLKRSSTYNYVDKLVKKGLAKWIDVDKKKMASATDPEELSRHIEIQKNSYINLQKTYHQLVPELHALMPQKNFSTQVKYYHGAEGIRRMLSNSIQSNKIYGYSCYGRNDIAGRDFMKDYRGKCLEKKIHDYVITNDPTLQITFPKEILILDYLQYQHARLLPKERFYITSDIMIYDNVYAVTSLDKNNPMGVEIVNDEIAKTELSIFKIMWDIAKPIKWKT